MDETKRRSVKAAANLEKFKQATAAAQRPLAATDQTFDFPDRDDRAVTRSRTASQQDGPSETLEDGSSPGLSSPDVRLNKARKLSASEDITTDTTVTDDLQHDISQFDDIQHSSPRNDAENNSASTDSTVRPKRAGTDRDTGNMASAQSTIQVDQNITFYSNIISNHLVWVNHLLKMLLNKLIHPDPVLHCMILPPVRHPLSLRRRKVVVNAREKIP